MQKRQLLREVKAQKVSLKSRLLTVPATLGLPVIGSLRVIVTSRAGWCVLIYVAQVRIIVLLG